MQIRAHAGNIIGLGLVAVQIIVFKTGFQKRLEPFFRLGRAAGKKPGDRRNRGIQ